MAVLVWPEGWPPPNYVDPPTRGSPSLFIITLIITAIVVVLRLYSRHFLTRSLGLDDGFLVAGFIFSIGQSVGEIKALTTWGWNKHIWDVPVDRLPKVRLAAWLVEFFFLFGNACSKISILLVYRKISSGSHSYWFIKLTWAAIAFTVLYTVALALELLLICRPLSSYWLSYNPVAYDKKFTCGNEHIPILFSATASVFSDIYASILPMLLTRTLKLTTRQRLSLYALFSAGLLTAGFGLGRLAVLDRVTTDYWPGPHTHDMTWLGWPLYALTDVEAHLAIICASAPALKVLFHHLRRRMSPSRQSSMQTPIRSTLNSNLARRPSSWAPLKHSHAYSQDSNTDVERLSLDTVDTEKPPTTPHHVHISQLQRQALANAADSPTTQGGGARELRRFDN